MELQQQRRRFSPWVRVFIVIFIVLILALAVLFILWVLVQWHFIYGPNSVTISATASWVYGHILLVISAIVGTGLAIIGTNAKDIWSWLRPKIYQSPQVEPDGSVSLPAEGTIPLPSQALPVSISAFNEPLTDPGEFIGREREYDKIIGRIKKGASSSIVGPRRIGKSWLLSYLKLTVPGKLDDGSEYRYQIGYLDATLPSCSTVDGFVNKVLEELAVTPAPGHTTELGVLEEAVKGLKAQKTVPILCIDEFEGLTQHAVFDYAFFTHLRAISQWGLVLVIASQGSLITLVSSATRGSKFFNIFREFRLEPFAKSEAQRFIQVKSQLGGITIFTPEEQTFLLEYTKEKNQWPLAWHPVRLQIAVDLLLEDKKKALDNLDRYDLANEEYQARFQQRLEQEYRAAMKAEMQGERA